MYLYKIYGMIVESDIELGEAYECRESAYAQVSIRYADMQEEIGRIEETIRTERAEWSEDGQEWSVCEINRNRSMLYYHTIGRESDRIHTGHGCTQSDVPSVDSEYGTGYH